MSEFFKPSRVWVVNFVYDGRARQWFKALRSHEDPQRVMANTLQDLYGDRARLISVREATALEDLDYLRGDRPRNVFCPTGH